MMDILDEFPCNITCVDHIHFENNITLTFVSCRIGGVHVYGNDKKIGFCNVPVQCERLAKHLLKLKHIKDMATAIDKVKKSLLPFQMQAVSMFDFVGEYFIAVLNNGDLIFFQNALREGLLKEKIFSNILGYATSTVSLIPVLKDKHTVVLTKTISLKNNNNGSIVVDKHGFAAFFGLEASLCCSDILLLCLSNGTIWYLPLNSSLGTPSFLYSLNDECIEVGTRKYDDTVTLLFCTKCGKVTSLIPKCDHFKVEVHWIKKDDDQVPNICCNRTNYFEQCRNSLIAKRNVLVLPRTNVFAVTNSTNLHRLRMDISELGKRRKTLNKFHEEAQTAIIRHKDLANLSIKSEDLFKYHFTESYLHVEVTDTNVSPLDFQVVLQSNSSSKTISSSSHTISVPFSDAVDCCQAKCFVCRNDVLIGSDSIKFNILNFMTYSSNVLWLEKRFSFKLLLCRSLTSQSIDFLKFLFQPEIVVKKQIFSLKIASDEIFVKFMLSSNEKQTAFHATSSNEYILWKFKSLMAYRLHNINKGSESAAL